MWKEGGDGLAGGAVYSRFSSEYNNKAPSPTHPTDASLTPFGLLV